MEQKIFDKVIAGAGLYGLYSAELCARNGQSVVVLECDTTAFARATYINQARVHQGYHYPRSLSTALKSAGYFRRFNEDFGFCINREFEQIYATSSKYSWSNAEQFNKFCEAADIPCTEICPSRFFQPDVCDGSFLTREYTYDASILREYYLEKISSMPNIEIHYGVRITRIDRDGDRYVVYTEDRKEFRTGFLLNVSYASVNQITKMLGFEPFKIKYELCEMILCDTNAALKHYGITVMDGPFFSIMPFGKTGLHSLTSVTFTPHRTSYEEVPTFECQAGSEGYCSSRHLGNCNQCPAKPKTAFAYMSSLAEKYLKADYQFGYRKSLFSMKPVLMASEVDDSRPTVIRTYTKGPTFVSVLSGKINTVYDLDEVLLDEK